MDVTNVHSKVTGVMEMKIVKQEAYLFYKYPIDVVEAFPLCAFEQLKPSDYDL